ncbi:MAG: RNA 2',3'-cyclic phosphodiesterase [Rhodospirillales bacterium]|nr:RNA 2',3'-cyclic phosphodiesterase [Rhodospirillales bacterium]
MTPPLFVAIAMPLEIATRLEATCGGVPGARWVPAENMHVTLRYLGELDGTLADDVCAVLTEIEAERFELAIAGVNRFGNRKDSHVLFTGLAPREPLKRLRDKIEIGLQRLGVKADERKYHPHVTLARLHRAQPDRVGRFLEANGLMTSQPFGVESFSLYESIRGSDGAVYREIERYGLRERAG